jgi:LysR family transcriptional regulator (chromosome initiation inhibitor)
MIDGKLLDALVAVVQLRSFEKAAQRLGITQSAVSQRIQLLEAIAGRPLVVRSPQTEPTAAGERLAKFAQQVESLETDAMAAIGARETGGWLPLPIGVNADSLATWFKDALDLLLAEHRTALELMVRDQSETLDLLRAGSVLACVSSWPEPIQGCSCTPLGAMVYRCVASREALARLRATKLDRKLAAELPAVVFGLHDNLLADYVKSSIGLERLQYPSHIVPSTADLLEFVVSGHGYSLLPALQIEGHLKRGDLIDINPKRIHSVNLYWHRWKIPTDLVEKLSGYVVTAARARLRKS